jgi:hypothetical protein
MRSESTAQTLAWSPSGFEINADRTLHEMRAPAARSEFSVLDKPGEHPTPHDGGVSA